MQPQSKSQQVILRISTTKFKSDIESQKIQKGQLNIEGEEQSWRTEAT